MGFVLTEKKTLVVGMMFFIMSIPWIAPNMVQAGSDDNRIAQIKEGFDGVRDLRGDSGVQDISLAQHLQNALKAATSLVAIIAVAVIIYGGVLYITSAGDPKKAEQAKSLVLYTIVGLLLIGAAAIIVNFILGIFV